MLLSETRMNDFWFLLISMALGDEAAEYEAFELLHEAKKAYGGCRADDALFLSGELRKKLVKAWGWLNPEQYWG